MYTARTKRLRLVKLFIFFVLAGTAFLALQPIKMLFNKNIELIRERIIRQLEEMVNRPIRYSSLGPSIIGSLELYNLTIGDENCPLLSLNRLYIEYSLLDLFKKRGIAAVRNFVLEDPIFYFDTEKDKDISRLFSSDNKKLELPPECSFHLKNGSFAFSHKGTVFSVTSVSIDGGIQNRLISLNGVWEKDNSIDRGFTLEGSVGGSFSEEFDKGTVSITLDSMEGRGLTVDRIGFELSFLEDRITLERKADALPLGLSALYLRDTGEFLSFFQAENFLPSSIIHFRGPLEQFTPALSLAISGNAGFSLNRGKHDDSPNNLSYYFSVSGESWQTAGEIPLRSFILEGAGNEKKLDFSQFAVNARTGFLSYIGDIQFSPLIPQGKMLFSNFSFTGDTGVNGTLSFFRTGQRLVFNAPSLALGKTAFSSFGGDIVINQEGRGFVLEFDRYLGSEKNDYKTSFQCQGTISKKSGQNFLSGTAEFSSLYINDVINIARPFITLNSAFLSRTEKISVTAAIGFSTDFKSINYETENFKAFYGTTAGISVSISGNEKNIVLNGGLIQWQGKQALFDLSTDFSNVSDISFLCNFSYLDFYYGFTGKLINGNVLSISGEQNFSAMVAYEQGSWSGFAKGALIPVPFRGRGSYLNIEAGLSYSNPYFWDLNLSGLELHDLSGRTELFAQGQANQKGFNLDRFYYADNAGPLSGSAAGIWNNGFSFVDGSFFLMDPGETEKLAGDIFYEHGNLEFHGSVTNLKGERFSSSAKNMRLSGEFYGGLSAEGHYLVNLSLKSLSGKVGETSFSLSGLALLDPEKLIFSQFIVSAGGLQSNIPYISIDRNAGHFETETQFYGYINNQMVGMSVHLGINFEPMKNWLDFECLNSFSGILDIPYAYINDLEAIEPFSFVFTRTPINETERISPAVYRISGGPRDMLSAELRESGLGKGVFSVSLRNPFPVQGFVTGIYNGTNIDALASEVSINLRELWDISPLKKIINFTGGIIAGEARIFGSLFDPEFEGTAWGTGITITVPDFIPVEIGPGSGIINLESSGFSFGPVAAPCGNGYGIIYASFSLNHWKLSCELDIEVEREVPFDFNIIGVMANGNAKGTLNIFQDSEDLLAITGELIASDTVITLNTDEIENAMSGTTVAQGIDIEANMMVYSSKMLEFLWPDSKTPFLRAYGEVPAGVRIMADTRVPMFAMDGNVFLRGGEVYHLSRNFYIREGQLQFKGNETEFNPLFSARAEIRDNNDEGPVTIFMIMENVPLSELLRMETPDAMPRYESIPSLSVMEIYAILGQAPPMDTPTAQDAFNPLIKSTTEVFLQRVVFRPVEQKIRNALGLDMFSFRTQILQNYLFETVRNRNPDEQPATMGNYLDNTTVFIGKYIGPDLFSQAMLSFRYDPARIEYYGGMRPELELGLDFRTPFFNGLDIRWNLGPIYLENLYANDFVASQSIMLLWRWSL